MRIVFLLLLFSVLPTATEAAVTFSEIAWMGTETSPNHEWIELYNDGTTVDVTGWTLKDTDTLNITLQGVIHAGEYVVLERTSDDSAPGTAFLLYTGALKNSGTTLTLKRTDGGIEDQVSSGTDWSGLGGDNVTKATAQYTNGGWITAVPTPGQVNATQPQVVELQLTQDSQNPKSTGSARLAEPVAREAKTLVLPGSTLELTLNAPTQVFVNQPIEFGIDTRGVGKTIENSLHVYWNFGDIHTGTGKHPTHTYTYPGQYVVIVTAEYASQSTTATHEITVLPVSVSLTKNKAGDIQVHNDSPYTIDISGYRLRGAESFDFPSHTKVLSRQTITVPMKKLGATHNQMVALYDSAGILTASTLPTILAETNSDMFVKQITPPVASSVVYQQEVQNQTVEEYSEYSSSTVIVEPAVPEGMTYFEIDESSKTTQDWSILALIALLGISSLAVLLKPLPKKDSLDTL